MASHFAPWKRLILSKIEQQKDISSKAVKAGNPNVRSSIVLALAPIDDNIFPSVRFMAFQVGFAGSRIPPSLQDKDVDLNPLVESDLLCFITDKRSSKVKILAEQIKSGKNGVEVGIWNEFEKSQFRLQGFGWIYSEVDNSFDFPGERLQQNYIRFHSEDEQKKGWSWTKEKLRAFGCASASVRSHFLGPEPLKDYDERAYSKVSMDIPPDTVLESDSKESETAFQNAALIVIEVLKVEHYKETDKGVERYIHSPQNLDTSNIKSSKIKIEALSWPKEPKRVND